MFFTPKTKDWVETYGSELLKGQARAVAAITPDIRALAERMYNLMTSLEGIGLAAPQAGEGLRVITLGLTDPRRSNPDSPGEHLLIPRMPMSFVNPEVLSTSQEAWEMEEGCLSVPNIFAPVVRPFRIVFRAQTLEGEKIEMECAGMLARLIQHECDHLQGVTFIERLDPAARRDVEREVRRLIRRGEKNNFRKAVIV